MPKLIDLFCGCGGMSLGFQNAGFEIVAAYDNWSAAVETYSKNFFHPVYKYDLTNIDGIISEISTLNPDIIIGGPPCQDFSIAGKRNFDGERANLTLAYANIIRNVRPVWFVMENVYNIQKSPIFAQAIDIFRESGYGLNIHIFDASLMGVPQARKRCFVIGKLNSSDNFLMKELLSNLSKTRTSVRDYLGNSLGYEYYYMHPRSYNRRAVFSIDEPSATIRGVNRPMPISYKFHPADKTKDSSKIKVLSSEERSFIQTFPKGFKFEGTKSEIEQQIGNAVPVKMSEYIAKIIIQHFS